MKDFLIDIAELLEEEEIKEEDILEDFEEWDSLTILSIIAFSNEKYGTALSTIEINDSKTVGGLKKLIAGKM